MIKINQKIADFELDAYHDQKIKKIKLSQFKGRWLVLMFYPADFTFICPTEMEEMASYHKEFRKLEAEILSISTDTAFAHKAWYDTSPAIKKVNFPMGSDPTGRLSREFGVYIEEEGLALRGTFVVNPNGILKSYEVNDNSIGRSAGELLRKLQAARFVDKHKGQVCPASWKPGKETLKPKVSLVGKI